MMIYFNQGWLDKKLFYCFFQDEKDVIRSLDLLYRRIEVRTVAKDLFCKLLSILLSKIFLT